MVVIPVRISERDWWRWALARYGRLVARAVARFFRDVGRVLLSGLERIAARSLVAEALHRLAPGYWVSRLRWAVRGSVGLTVRAAAEDERVRHARGSPQTLIDAIGREVRRQRDRLLAAVGWAVAFATLRADVVRAVRGGLATGGTKAAVANARRLFRGRRLYVRAARVGHTEGHAAIGGGKEAARSVLYAEGFLNAQEWRCIFRNSREDHIAAHEQVVAYGRPFVVGGEPARYPGDPQLSAANRIGCQCWTRGLRLSPTEFERRRHRRAVTERAM
jgi:hypothetical protein